MWWTVLDCAGPCWTVLDCAGLCWTVLETEVIWFVNDIPFQKMCRHVSEIVSFIRYKFARLFVRASLNVKTSIDSLGLR
jgi:hypothetical protein